MGRSVVDDVLEGTDGDTLLSKTIMTNVKLACELLRVCDPMYIVGRVICRISSILEMESNILRYSERKLLAGYLIHGLIYIGIHRHTQLIVWLASQYPELVSSSWAEVRNEYFDLDYTYRDDDYIPLIDSLNGDGNSLVSLAIYNRDLRALATYLPFCCPSQIVLQRDIRPICALLDDPVVNGNLKVKLAGYLLHGLLSQPTTPCKATVNLILRKFPTLVDLSWNGIHTHTQFCNDFTLQTTEM